MLIINYGWFDIKSILVALINLEMAMYALFNYTSFHIIHLAGQKKNSVSNKYRHSSDF